MTATCTWKGAFGNDAVNALHAEGFDHAPLDTDWHTQLHRHSLGWVCAHEGEHLVGFLNIAWDGGAHAFALDTVVARTHRGQGLGRALLATAEREARAAGCEWLHVDYEDELRPFYVDACGFAPTGAGLIPLA